MNKLTLIASAAALTLLAACDKRDDQTVGQAIDQSVASAEKKADESGQAIQRGGEKVADAAADASLTAKVKTALLSTPDVGGLKIDVDTKSGVVTLKGDVKSADEKSRAERVASAVEGVQSVVNDLRIAG
jgi:osmotically-inducible protein OsmY